MNWFAVGMHYPFPHEQFLAGLQPEGVGAVLVGRLRSRSDGSTHVGTAGQRIRRGRVAAGDPG
ncbi:MAG TPA: hypothetical protein VGL80_26475 [Pseudonocardiaceae bacterium]